MQGQWNTLKDFFEDMNTCCQYAVLRNWENIEYEKPYMEGHEDIDLLCDSIDKFIAFSNAKRIHYLDSRDNYVVTIHGKEVRMDIRHIGDGYYDAIWEKQLLNKRKKNSFFYVVAEEQYPYALAYHALIQKDKLSEEYREKIGNLFNKSDITERDISVMLVEYTQKNNYKATVPRDPGVMFNRKNAILVGLQKDKIRILKRFIFRVKSKLGFRV